MQKVIKMPRMKIILPTAVWFTGSMAMFESSKLKTIELSNDVEKVVYVQDLQEDTSKLNELTPADADLVQADWL